MYNYQSTSFKFDFNNIFQISIQLCQYEIVKLGCHLQIAFLRAIVTSLSLFISSFYLYPRMVLVRLPADNIMIPISNISEISLLCYVSLTDLNIQKNQFVFE